MEDELWMKKIKERLEDYSEPIPASGWERLEKELSIARPSIVGGRRIIPFRRWRIASAAALLVAVSSISLWLLQSQVGDEVRRTNAPALAVVPDMLPRQATPSMQTDAVKPLYQTPKKTSTHSVSNYSLVAQQIDTPTEQIEQTELFPSESIDNVDINSRIESSAASQVEEVDAKQTDEPEKKQIERRRPSGKDKLHLPVERKPASKSNGWSVGLGVSNAGGLGNALGNGVDPYGPVYNLGTSSGRLDLMDTEGGVVSIPGEQELFFKDGLPYLRKRDRSIESIDHKQPLSFGFSVRKNLPKGFSVETGLTYTYLASDIKFDDSSEKLSQKLHYIGIPVRANWNFVDKKSFTMYVSTGGAVEKCVYGKIGTDSETVKPLQLSIMSAVGAQYNISNKVGLYVEPGVSYFFDDGSDVETIRKENPLNFTLQAGIRLTY